MNGIQLSLPSHIVHDKVNPFTAGIWGYTLGMEYLDGGRKNQIVRSGNTIIRPAGKWSNSVHQLLTHLHKNGCNAVPEALGFDEQGNEIVSFIEGDVCNYPLSENAKSLEMLQTAASLLRTYHDTTITFFQNNLDQQQWMLPTRQPIEVICHGDYAPYNVVLNGRIAIGIIDFDTAHPGPRIWDIAYALYRWAPFTNPRNDDGWGTLTEQVARAKRFCDAYELATAERKKAAEVIIQRLQALVDFMHAEAQNGNETFQQNIADDHHLSYLQDIAYIEEHKQVISQQL